MGVEMKKDRLDEFISECDRVIIHMTKAPAEDLKLALSVKQVRQCPKLKTTWDNYFSQT